MAFTFLGPDPLEAQIQDVLARLTAGEAPGQIERARVDIKEEPGRRAGSAVLPGMPTSESAAAYLAAEMACFANTPGGGAVVLGISDVGVRIGTDLEAEWIRHRIWELTEGRLTVDVRVGILEGTRLLVLTTQEAIEPVRYGGRYRWRVDDNCVEIDPTSWHSRRLSREGFDWSSQPSGHRLDDISPAAVERARQYLNGAGDESALDLAGSTAHDLIRRLNLVDGSGILTNAGSLLFVGTPAIGIDYIRRTAPGSDSTARIRSNRPLIEQVWDVDQASQAANRVVHVSGGFAHAQLRAIPPRALREAIVNGVVHRDWLSPHPTTVEHVADSLVVTSPGGFVGGVSATNIITHPSAPRYRGLAEAMAALRLAEREGIGVDRMVRDMLALGRPAPQIDEVAGPNIRAVLIGGEPDSEQVRLLASLPDEVRSDLDALLIIDHLMQQGWIDIGVSTRVLQRTGLEAGAALERLAQAPITGGTPVIVSVEGSPLADQRAYRFSKEARRILARSTKRLAQPSSRGAILIAWAQHRGRISTTEAASLLGLSSQACGSILRVLEDEGALEPGRSTRLGRGFFYVPRA